ncbi:uracil-DNA glycosylase [Alteribacter keqinensis]|uniref:uracil-DNA glycosylase n=1 Tax=Alteribacter keqinensis TaxID=2483800 RepID=UPI001606C2DE|nr:uracil-DNA glycosylase [Alteribacter keqinensis]
MVKIITNDWEDHIGEEFSKPYYKELRAFLVEEYNKKAIFPPMHDIYNALNTTSFKNTKVVILGQDPYHGPNQAHGLSFSVKPGERVPPSLRNMYQELNADLGCPVPEHGYLQKWAEEGVLLLNTVLTVRKGEAGSHQGRGWETFTDQVIRTLNERSRPVVFMLWGKQAQKKQELITNRRHLVINSPHPSPFSARRGFFGSRPFSRANAFLQETGSGKVDWTLPVTVDQTEEETV